LHVRKPPSRSLSGFAFQAGHASSILVALVYTAVGIVLNSITKSTAERAVWAPVSIVLLILVAIVMGTTRRSSQIT
jgi:hypothetical protein